MRPLIAVLAAAALAGALLRVAPERRLVRLPSGVVNLHSEMLVDSGVEVQGGVGTVLRLSGDFHGRAAIVVRGSGVRLANFTVDGNRDALEARSGLPPWDTPFARFTGNNGVFADGVSEVTVENVRFRNIAGFSVLASGAHRISIDRVEIVNSGSRNPAGRNNATGGILFEEGTTEFQVTRCELRNVRGNGVWTHSLYRSPRNARGVFAGNRFVEIGRDALQAGHASQVRIEHNSGRRIGYPPDMVDVENGAVPVGIDTAGNVDRSVYAYNRFDDVNGKCIDLDGFHDGEVRGNVCVGLANFGIVMNNSNPDMRSQNVRIVENIVESGKMGGIFVIGSGNLVARNQLAGLNAAHYGIYSASDPDLLRAGIYLGRGAERSDPARGNKIENNEISGYQMKARCIAIAPGIPPEANTIRGNRCR